MTAEASLPDEDAHQLKERWLDCALSAAAIDRRHWHPAAGVDANKRTIEAVYAYYGRRFAEPQPPFLLWAGMASLVGATFYAAFLDIGLVPDAGRALARALSRMFGWRRRSDSADAAGELGFYETLFLTMQKKIFEDQASMQEAYLACGLPEIERFYRAGIIDLATLAAWREVERGRMQNVREALENGCRMLLWREQREIIGHFYETMMNHHGLEGHLFTYAMTVGGAPSVPGARSESEVYPFILRWRLARSLLRLSTPLPRGNIARFTTRWSLVEADTLPAYLRFVAGSLSEARQLAVDPVAQRAVAYRLKARLLPLSRTLLTGWRVSLAPGPVAGADPSTTITAQPLVLDLDPPRADAVPNQLTVSLPFGNRDDTEELVEQYARGWGIDSGQVARWKHGVGRASGSADRTYATHVLRPPPLGDVQLEFEIAQHVRENRFHITALFSSSNPSALAARAAAERSPE